MTTEIHHGGERQLQGGKKLKLIKTNFESLFIED